MQVVLVSGLSGSGKSIAIAVLEDIGYYCVDNLPLAMLQPLVDYLKGAGHERIAIAIDARSSASFSHLPAIAEALRERGADLRMIFLEAKTLTLVKRFSETRRRHPLSSESVSLQEAIQMEREMLGEIALLAHRIDTSDLSAAALRLWIKSSKPNVDLQATVTEVRPDGKDDFFTSHIAKIIPYQSVSSEVVGLLGLFLSPTY